MMTCVICEKPYAWRWTDTHGIAACASCGMPYRLYHYSENDEREDKPPSIAIDEAWLPLARAYWQETHERVFPGAYDIGLLRSRGGRTYSGATEEQMRAFDDWINARKHLWPPTAQVEVVTETI